MKRLTPDDCAQVMESLGLDPETKQDIRGFLDRLQVTDKQDEIYKAGSAAEELYVILQDQQGTPQRVRLAAVVPTRVDPVTVLWVLEGCFGEAEFVRRNRMGVPPPRSLSSFAPQPIRCVRIPYARLLELDASLLAKVERKLTQDALARAETVMTRFSSSKVTSKAAQLAQALLELGEDAGVKEGSGLRVDMKIRQEDLGHEVGLTREAVNANLREWQRAGVVRLSPSSLQILDRKRLETLVMAGHESSRAAHDGFLKNLDALIANGENFRARNMALDALDHFPKSAEIRYRAFLAAVRTGSLAEAKRLMDQIIGSAKDNAHLREILSHAIATGSLARWGGNQRKDEEEDADAEAEFKRQLPKRLSVLLEDVLSGRARLLKDQALGSHRKADRTLTPAAARAYEDTWKLTHGYFPAINAATLYRIAGNTTRATELARQAKAAVRKASDYWELATLGEAELILGNTEAAKSAFAQALAANDASPGAVASTRLQLTRLGPALGMREQEIADLLPQGAVIVYSGHLTPKTDNPSDLPPEIEKELKRQVTARLRAANAMMGFGALGAGGDSIVAEAMLSTQVGINVVLPFQRDDFADLSVTGRVSPDGMARFSRQLERATSLRTLADERLARIPEHEHDERFRHANRHMLGLALLKADELVAPARLFAISDGNPAQSIAGTAHFIDLARQLGVAVEVIDCPWRKRDPRLAPKTLSDRALYAPVVFVWSDLEAGRGSAGKSFMSKALAKWPRAAWTDGFPKTTPRLAVSAHVTDDIETALDLTADLMNRADQAGAAVRVVCDFGPVRPGGRIDVKRLKRLAGADDGLQMPWNEAAASEAFAAEVRLIGNAGVKCWPAGRALVSEKYGDAQPKSSVPMYQLQW